MRVVAGKDVIVDTEEKVFKYVRCNESISLGNVYSQHIDLSVHVGDPVGAGVFLLHNGKLSLLDHSSVTLGIGPHSDDEEILSKAIGAVTYGRKGKLEDLA